MREQMNWKKDDPDMKPKNKSEEGVKASQKSSRTVRYEMGKYSSGNRQDLEATNS